ncbi:MAG: NAD(P)H-dependent glycerol-3-phosphate dehydrogenase [Desulfatiglandaceae bacterium]
MRDDEIKKIGVIGAGSWGTTIGNLLAEKGLEVDIWVRESAVYEEMRDKGKNSLFLPGMRLAEGLRPVQSFEAAVGGKEVIVLAIPSHVFREVLTSVAPHLEQGAKVMILTKGIENHTLMLMSEVAATLLDKDQMEYFACLTGPSFAKEVCRRSPTAVTIACGDEVHARRLQRLFATDFFRVYVSDDVVGTQLAGALKNVIAIAAGASDGLDFGHNARAALITRGLAEMTRLGLRLGASPETFAGLAGLGDLVLTCTGELSRNRTVGLKIGKGLSLEVITEGMDMVAEGIRNTRSAHELAVRMQVAMPITAEVYQILYEGKAPADAVRELMTRDLKAEAVR